MLLRISATLDRSAVDRIGKARHATGGERRAEKLDDLTFHRNHRLIHAGM